MPWSTPSALDLADIAARMPDPHGLGLNALPVRTAQQATATAISSMDPRFYVHHPAVYGSTPRPCRPEPTLVHPLACPVSRDTSNPTNGACRSPRACTHGASAPKRTYFHGKARLHDEPDGAGGCGSAFAHICARRHRATRRCASQPLPRAASRSSWQLVRTCCRARVACASRFDV